MMADVRRSSRGNKGQNPRLEVSRKFEDELGKSSGKRKSHPASSATLANTKKQRQEESKDSNRDNHASKSENEKVFEEVRCLVCGVIDANYDEEEDENGTMIECESCLSWQHLKCMFGSSRRKAPNMYFCEICSPKSFANIKHKLSPETYFAEIEAQGINTRATDVEKHVNGELDSDNDTDYNYESQTDKQIDGYDVQEESEKMHKNSKSKKSGSRSKRNEALMQEMKVRDGVIERFKKIYKDCIIPQMEDAIPNESDITQWGRTLEDLLYNKLNDTTNQTDPGTKYRERFRNLFASLRDRKNTFLRDRLITGDLELVELVEMKTEELINPEMQKFRIESIKQKIAESTLKPTSQVPKMKKTHKGDEIIEDEGDNFNEENLVFFSGGKGQNSDDTKTYDDPIAIDIKGKQENEKKPTTSSKDPRKRSVKKKQVHFAVNQGYEEIENSIGSVDDTGLDEILGTNSDVIYDEGEMKQISENDSKENEPVFWQGHIQLADLPDFYTEVVFCGNSDPQSTRSSDICYALLNLNQSLELEGRLDKRRAEDYLREIASTRNIILSELIETDENRENYVEVFDYFKSKSRYGVIKNPRKSYIKDIYLTPIDADSKEHLPEFLRSIVNFKFMPKLPKLYLIFTVKKDYIPDQTFVDDIKNEVKTIGNQRNKMVPKETSKEYLARAFNDIPKEQLDILFQIIDEHPDAKDPKKLIEYVSALTHKGVINQ
ncbi:Bye1 protein [Saccharomycopsis crataegensis]|uniref:Transcription factor BYE1 n=1 Tax=Saccharomycopsis crataegensis TaxID=43959 RepID=A0AAV5QTQ5_9ASCO|nr:Bye1 protein [Saccharomycopsis crataegensis]